MRAWFALLLAACPSSTSSVRLVTPADTVAVDDCVLVNVPAHVVSARCADEAICDVDQTGSSSVLVRGKAAGTTMVEVDYDRPDSGRGSDKLKVTFVAPVTDALHPSVTNTADACPTRRQQMGP